MTETVRTSLRSHYASPELVMDGEVDIRSDIFSLGAVFYHVLTGQLPFDGKNAASLAEKIINTEPPPVREWNSSVPQSLELICGKAMAKNPEKRYGSPAEMLESLEGAPGGLQSPEKELLGEGTIVSGKREEMEETISSLEEPLDKQDDADIRQPSAPQSSGPVASTPPHLSPAPENEAGANRVIDDDLKSDSAANAPPVRRNPVSAPPATRTRPKALLLILLLLAGVGAIGFTLLRGVPQVLRSVVPSLTEPTQKVIQVIEHPDPGLARVEVKAPPGTPAGSGGDGTTPDATATGSRTVGQAIPGGGQMPSEATTPVPPATSEMLPGSLDAPSSPAQGNLSTSPGDSGQIRHGMTSAQVRQIMGGPAQVKKVGRLIEWEYRTPAGTFEVRFRHDRVVFTGMSGDLTNAPRGTTSGTVRPGGAAPLGGATAPGVAAGAFGDIRVGMTMEEVRQTLGNPARLERLGGAVEWEFFSPDGKFEVRFQNNKVVSTWRLPPR
jgi:hypothetical protein